MVQAFGALNQPAKAATAQEVITDARPTAATYTQLAIFAYQAGQTRKGDLAKNKALELTDPDMREALKGQLESGQAAGGRRGRRSPAPPRSSFYTARCALVAQLAEQRTLIRRFQVRFLAGASNKGPRAGLSRSRGRRRSTVSPMCLG